MNKKVYDFGVFQDYGTDDPNSLIKDNSSIIYGTDEEGNQIYYSAGENITLDGGKISSTGSGGGNVDDVEINGNSILNDKIANINLGANLSFDESSNTLNVLNAGNVDDVQIDGVSILNEKIANINLGDNLTFDSANTLNVIGLDFDNEHISIQLFVNEGSVDFSGYSVTVYYGGETYQYQLNSNGETEFDIPLGVEYRISYPTINGYYDVSDSKYISMKRNRTITKIYQYYGDAIRMVLLEQSNPNDWTTAGSEQIVDTILNKYGTYVIDEINKKYAKLSSSDHTYFEDGSIWDGSYGNSFRHLPETFYLVDNDNEGRPVLKISFVDIGGHSWPDAWIGTYKGSVVNGLLRSIPDATTTQNMAMTNFWNAARQVGVDYGLVNYFQHCMLVGLHYAKFGTSNSENTMGPGLQDAGSTYYTHQTGFCKALGDGTGSMPYAVSTTLTMNKLFGIEDLAGSTWEFRPNIRFSNNGTLATVYEGNIVSNTATGRTFYKLDVASGAYITKMALGEYCDFIPTAIGGTSGTYYCDGTWASTSGQLLRVGGASDFGSLSGVSASHSYGEFSYSNASVGARLAFYGDISQYTLVSGTELNSLHNL